MSAATTTCGYCGSEFEPSTHHSARNEFCSENCRKRAWHNAHRPLCECGARISLRATRCWDCQQEAIEQAQLARRNAIKELWDAGCSMKEITCDPRVGRSNVNSLGVEMARMRAAGWNLPSRRVGVRGTGPPRIIKSVYTPQEASRRVGHAVRSGHLTRPSECERCGREGRVEAHHHDYSKPLDVEWLCRSCHAAHHAAERRIHPGPVEVAA